MLREVTNKVKIEGILSEIDLKYGSYVKDGKTVENIGGSIKVRVNQVVNGEEQHLEIPVHMFSNKLTKKGTVNPSYTSIETIMNDFTSIAAAGGEAGADKVRINSAKVTVNEYYNQNGQLISFPRISANFAQRATGEFKPEATFEMEFALSNMAYELDKDGVEVEPKKLNITALVPQYGGKIDVIKLVATNPNVINAIESNWEKDYTYKAYGRLNFSSRTEKFIEEVGFGEPIEKVRTTTVSDLVITGGNPDPLEGDYGLDINDVIQALNERKARLEAMKTQNKSKKAPAAAPARGALEAMEDLGF